MLAVVIDGESGATATAPSVLNSDQVIATNAQGQQQQESAAPTTLATSGQPVAHCDASTGSPVHPSNGGATSSSATSSSVGPSGAPSDVGAAGGGGIGGAGATATITAAAGAAVGGLTVNGAIAINR